MSAYESRGETDEWYTPRYIFDALRIQFDLDVAAPSGGPRNVPCSSYLTKAECGLKSPWQGLVWMNPPFGHQATKIQWLQKFFDHGNGIALIPDRTSAPWWQRFARQADAVLFVAPKIKFERPDGSIGESPGTGTCLFGKGERSVRAMINSGLGLVLLTGSNVSEVSP
ncbi:DNA N-6-adenine-methyltransferase [Pseudomonas sp. C5pp]|uniref:DNA N-6-adenine-methyltransferase n=1 Tax=Pseudomonas sp. C5pp TaxID=1586081 RepID=UPI0009E3B998